MDLKEPGTAPAILIELENYLVPWIVEMQKNGHLVTLEVILVKENEIYREVNGTTQSV